MSTLTRQYRRALLWYPAWWRATNEEVVVGTLMDVADAEHRTRPRISEMVNLAAHGLSTRMRMLPAMVSPAVRDRTSTAALALGSAISLTAIMQLESNPLRAESMFGVDVVSFGPFASPAILLYFAWLAALLVSLAGFTVAGRWIIALTIPLAIGTRVFADASGMFLRPTWTFYVLLIMLAVLVVAGNPAAGRKGVRWLLCWFVPPLIVLLLPQLTNDRLFQNPAWMENWTVLSLPVLAWSPVVVVAASILLRLFGQRAWAASVLILGLPFAAVALSTMGRRAFEDVFGIAVLIGMTLAGCLISLRLLGLRVRIQKVASVTSSTHSPG